MAAEQVKVQAGETGQAEEGRGVSRRGFLFAGAGALAATSGMAADAFAWEPNHVELARHDVEVPGLPAALDGLRIAHLSDIHLYQGIHPAAQRAMALVSGLAPDITVITGDVVEHGTELTHAQEFFKACRGREATVVTLGNWEYQAGVEPSQVARAAESVGAVLLVNRSLVVNLRGAAVGIVGLDDPRRGSPDPAPALGALPSDLPALWAFHAPGYADLIRDSGFPAPFLALAGHTHGGQIRLPFLPAVTPPASGRFVAGWYRDTFAPLYVSRGIGTSGIRARFGAAPEVGVFTLRPVQGVELG